MEWLTELLSTLWIVDLILDLLLRISIKYKIDNNTTESDTVTLNPGDGLIIKEGVYHTPIIKEPRVTLSFSW